MTENQEEKFSFCLLGAAFQCYGHGSKLDEVISMILGKLGIPLNDNPKMQITTWNDQRDRTFDEVKKLIEELNI